MPRGYDFPAGSELWVPRAPVTENRAAHNWRVVGRLSDGVSQDQAQQDLSAIARRLKQQYGDDTAMEDAAIRPVLEQLVGDVRPALLVLLGAAGVLLLVACVNVANLLLARALSRDRESALRLALGARPAHLARSFLTESLVLALSGATLGVMLAIAGVPALLALEPGGLPRIDDIGTDWTVLGFALGTSVLSAVLIGLVPGIRAARRDVRESLADSHRIQSGSPASRRLRGALVVAQIALTVVLLVGAGLLGRSLQKLLAVDPGFRTDGAVVMEITFPSSQNALPEGAETRRVGFIEQLTARLQTIPGVERVGGVNHFPLSGGGANGTFVTLERPDEIASFEEFSVLANEPSRNGNAEFRVASADYFRAMDIPLVRGRFFDERDSPDTPHVALISASLAETRWPGQDPLGEIVFFGNMDGDLRPLTVVGVVGDVHEYGIGVPPRPTFYVDYRQRPRTAFIFAVAIQGQADAAALTATARRIARDLDPEVPVDFTTLRDVTSASLADRQFVLLLVALFGAVALVLATTGVYGVVVYIASQRTPEIGVRVALGAQAGDVVRLLVRQGVVFSITGVVIGLAAAFTATRVLASFLYEVGTVDLLTYAAVAVALFVAAAVASWMPARRASLLDPVEALRHE
jgi:predicted permease